MRKIFIIAGEASGDLHGANLVKALLSIDSSLEIQAYGGDKMAAAGAHIVRNYEANAFMGFYEVLVNLKKVLQNISITSELIEKFQPDFVVFIDFPGFNLRIAKKLKKRLSESRFYYYISPKVWAWKTSRVHLLNTLMDDIFVIFPFEESFYAQFGYKVTYVGNPLLDEIGIVQSKKKDSSLIAVLPGSRKQEIEKMLPIFAELSVSMPEYTFEVSTMPFFDRQFYGQYSKEAGQNLKFSERSTYDLLNESQAALVTSGTATLETALFNTPQVVAYKTSWLSYQIGRRIIKTKYISLVNIILDRPAVVELIQNELTVENLKAELQSLLSDNSKILSDYRELNALLGAKGPSHKVAHKILSES